ncbi:hypothetical protein L207DRAFT_589652 [Hyaloscypha variabilis F]|uniref:Uncharacterized protein n=1 Tax=Hyaloscypha variabilis (strain UAMH 11265 / GT02V1 / F) TaxID=1149755 RepID=A0A2J6R442_HYAVF|nr:hypothetical protein L207DRAFT_589652 [Hyaloscypha variabilis F]
MRVWKAFANHENHHQIKAFATCCTRTDGRHSQGRKKAAEIFMVAGMLERRVAEQGDALGGGKTQQLGVLGDIWGKPTTREAHVGETDYYAMKMEVVSSKTSLKNRRRSFSRLNGSKLGTKLILPSSIRRVAHGAMSCEPGIQWLWSHSYSQEK